MMYTTTFRQDVPLKSKKKKVQVLVVEGEKANKKNDSRKVLDE